MLCAVKFANTFAVNDFFVPEACLDEFIRVVLQGQRFLGLSQQLSKKLTT